jgi:hypothetical protein
MNVGGVGGHLLARGNHNLGHGIIPLLLPNGLAEFMRMFSEILSSGKEFKRDN